MAGLIEEMRDTGWEPEARTYTDEELRFTPLYRAFRALPWYSDVPDSDVLADCREAIAALVSEQSDDDDAQDDGPPAGPVLRLLK